MAAIALLNAVDSYLTSIAGLTPAPAQVGVIEPAANADLPAVVLSLSGLELESPGLGGRADILHGALPVSIEIDLANPELPGSPETRLISTSRKTIRLFHGGLARADGSVNRSLSADDLQVSIDGAAVDVIPSGPPQANQVRAFAAGGMLTFGTALPESGTLAVSYFVGQWERRVEFLRGQLLVDCIASNAADASGLGDQVYQALRQLPLDSSAFKALSPIALSSAAENPAKPANSQRRRSEWHFEYEHIIDRPESSGGLIRRVRAQVRADESPFESESIT